jgi:hypothetical protein
MRWGVAAFRFGLIESVRIAVGRENILTIYSPAELDDASMRHRTHHLYIIAGVMLRHEGVVYVQTSSCLDGPVCVRRPSSTCV